MFSSSLVTKEQIPETEREELKLEKISYHVEAEETDEPAVPGKRLRDSTIPG